MVRNCLFKPINLFIFFWYFQIRIWRSLCQWCIIYINMGWNYLFIGLFLHDSPLMLMFPYLLPLEVILQTAGLISMNRMFDLCRALKSYKYYIGWIFYKWLVYITGAVISWCFCNALNCGVSKWKSKFICTFRCWCSDFCCKI